MSRYYTSGFAGLIEEYISFKVSMGYSESTYNQILHQFDAFCAEKYPNAASLTKVIVEDWAQLQNKKEHKNGLQRRLICLNGFARYLLMTDREAYRIPDGTIGKSAAFLPYIYSDQELRDFFNSADHFPMIRCKGNQDLILPVLFRMMFCCGLRPQEVPNIKCNHVDMQTGVLFIEDSKIHKDRLLVMSDELTSLCRQYDAEIQKRIPERVYFYQLPDGNRISINWMQNQFRRCWRMAGRSFHGEHHPRNYDWRHNFATRAIMKWFDEGEDVYVNLPCLSTYMGHTKLQHTLYYISLLPEHLTRSGKMDWDCIPEVPAYEDE